MDYQITLMHVYSSLKFCSQGTRCSRYLARSVYSTCARGPGNGRHSSPAHAQDLQGNSAVHIKINGDELCRNVAIVCLSAPRLHQGEDILSLALSLHEQ